MYVRSLRLAGFKSFASATALDFEAGVNVIVGPNGSGKSNIADALSWVLGSQAPSSLRGASMEDVIFAGAPGRPRLGMAEVELTLDNEDRALPLDLNEVTLSRSTDRTGASEYRINGAPCRLLDVAELLSDTGIGRSIHTVVGQGQLDAVLHARPEDRRAFIEEAAQVGKYRRRKDRSLRKIERVEENLVRLSDMLSELKRALRPLRRQAEAAAVHSELVAEHRELRQRLAATEVLRLRHEGGLVDPEAEAKRATLLGEELAGVRALLERAAHEREELATRAEATQRTAHGIERVADRLLGLGRLADERAETVAARLAAETEEGYRERIRLLEGERERFTAETKVREVAASEAGARAAELDCRLAAATAATSEAEGVLGEARAAETGAAQAFVRAEGGEAAGRATLGATEARVKAVRERREVAERELSDQSGQLEGAEREVCAIETELDKATEQAAAAEAHLEEGREESERLAARLGASHADRSGAAARVTALEEVAELFAGETSVVSRLQPLLQDARDGDRLASADEDAARRIFATANDEVERRWQAVAALDEELRRLDALMSGAAARLAGRRRKREQREIELAALDEELSRASDALAAAERNAAEERAALPARRAALAEANAVRQDAETKLSVVRRAESELVRLAADARMEARSAQERELAAQLRREEAESGIADAERALGGLEDLRASLGRARQRARGIARVALAAAERGRTWAEEAEGRAGKVRAEARSSERKLASLRTRERELGLGLEQVAHRRNEAEVRRAQTGARIDAIAERAMDEWGLSRDGLVAFGRLGAEEEDSARERAARLDRDMRRLGPVNPRAAEEYEEVRERETFLVTQIEDLSSSKNDLMRVIKEVNDTIVEVFGEAFEAVAAEFQGVFERLFPGGEGRLRLIDPGDVLASGIEIDAKPAGKNVRKLSLLSGGERSLVALAFLFAIFRARPSPFYLLDEVEAALDDLNLQRFLGLVAELEERAQVLIVSHQKRTMEAADILYGVSMAKDGVSKVVAKRLEKVS